MAWIGKTMLGIGLVHSLFGFIGLRSTLAVLWSEGLVNTVNGQPAREFAFWFIAFGLLAMIYGAHVNWCEHHRVPLPRFLGWWLLTFTLVIVTIMPISGGWMMFIPSVGILLRRDREMQKQQSPA